MKARMMTAKACLVLVTLVVGLVVTMSVTAMDEELSDSIEQFERVLAELNCVQAQVEIEVQFVQFEKSDINQLAKEGPVDMKRLMSLWADDKAELLFAPKVVTQSGVEATTKGIKEYIYPTEYMFESSGGDVPVAMTIPTEWVTREVGVILTALPEVSPNNNVITLAIAPEIVAEPEWKRYVVEYPGVDGANVEFAAEQPFFRTDTLATTVRIHDGARIMLAGGIANAPTAKVVYAFVSVRLLGPDGEPIRKKAR